MQRGRSMQSYKKRYQTYGKEKEGRKEEDRQEEGEEVFPPPRLI